MLRLLGRRDFGRKFTFPSSVLTRKLILPTDDQPNLIDQPYSKSQVPSRKDTAPNRWLWKTAWGSPWYACHPSQVFGLDLCLFTIEQGIADRD